MQKGKYIHQGAWMGQKTGMVGAKSGHRWGSFDLPRGMKGAILILSIKKATAPHFLHLFAYRGAWMGQKGHDWGSFKLHREGKPLQNTSVFP